MPEAAHLPKGCVTAPGAIPHHYNVEPESDSVYVEWMPSVMKRWDAFEGGDKNAKKYTAFLRFVFKAYMIPARVNIRRFCVQGWVVVGIIKKHITRNNKCQVLQIQ